MQSLQSRISYTRPCLITAGRLGHSSNVMATLPSRTSVKNHILKSTVSRSGCQKRGEVAVCHWPNWQALPGKLVAQHAWWHPKPYKHPCQDRKTVYLLCILGLWLQMLAFELQIVCAAVQTCADGQCKPGDPEPLICGHVDLELTGSVRHHVNDITWRSQGGVGLYWGGSELKDVAIGAPEGNMENAVDIRTFYLWALEGLFFGKNGV